VPVLGCRDGVQRYRDGARGELPGDDTATATGTTAGGPVESGPSTATVTVRVSAPPPVLAGTGNDTARQLLIGVLLVLGGAAVLLLARRRS
jgi:hypothetical protein